MESALPLGIDHEIGVEQHMMRLEPSDSILLFTDGIIESFNRDREMFGMERLDQSMHDCSGEPACIIDPITAALAEHQSEDRPADDQTIVAMRALE